MFLYVLWLLLPACEPLATLERAAMENQCLRAKKGLGTTYRDRYEGAEYDSSSMVGYYLSFRRCDHTDEMTLGWVQPWHAPHCGYHLDKLVLPWSPEVICFGGESCATQYVWQSKRVMQDPELRSISVLLRSPYLGSKPWSMTYYVHT